MLYWSALVLAHGCGGGCGAGCRAASPGRPYDPDSESDSESDSAPGCPLRRPGGPGGTPGRRDADCAWQQRRGAVRAGRRARADSEARGPGWRLAPLMGHSGAALQCGYSGGVLGCSGAALQCAAGRDSALGAGGGVPAAAHAARRQAAMASHVARWARAARERSGSGWKGLGEARREETLASPLKLGSMMARGEAHWVSHAHIPAARARSNCSTC